MDLGVGLNQSDSMCRLAGWVCTSSSRTVVNCCSFAATMVSRGSDELYSMSFTHEAVNVMHHPAFTYTHADWFLGRMVPLPTEITCRAACTLPWNMSLLDACAILWSSSI